MATRVIDDIKLQNIAVAIQNKDGGGTMTDDEMPTRIAAISTIPEKPDPNGALLLMDWEGTILQSYTHAEAMALEALPNVADTPYYPLVDHELLTFQTWTYTLAYAQDYLRNRPYGQFVLGAIYTTTDGQNHDYWNNPRLINPKSIYMQKRGVNSIGNNAFNNCYSLTQINIPDGVTSIGSYAFNNCTSLTQINIPDGVTSIDKSTFQDCTSLTQINIPDGVTSIGGYAFYNCYSLTQINIPDGVTSIGSYYAFYNCYSLTQINIPDGVTSIGSYAFQGCRELYDVVIHGKPALSDKDAFGGAPSTQKIYVHRSDLSWYETATNWSTIYAQGKIVAAADYLDHLISIGIDVTDFENEVIA